MGAPPAHQANWHTENGFHFTHFGVPERARSSFEGALALSDDNALFQPRIGALIGLARLEMGLGDLRRAQQFVEELEVLGPARLGRQRGWVLHLRARLEMLSVVPKSR